MAEVKNSFLESKMNKDLDDRLIPNGQYRDALNVSVGKTEDEDVGALEAILGNKLVIGTGNSNLICIGQFADNQNNRIFQFWSNYKDPNPDAITPATSGDMRITVYDVTSSTGSLTTLVSGVFLNFATNSQFRIIGVNVLEDLLFWTDNRNQPRKINITKALSDSSYYTTETQISVAKYAPVLPPSVYLDVNVTTTSASSSPTPQSRSFTVSSSDALKLNIGMQLLYTNLGLNDYAVITSISSNTVTISVPNAYSATIPSGTSLNLFGSSMTNEADDPSWPGDPNYLKDIYIRMSYRYKFDDGEYSLMAPFTQILFIPNQNGYFLNGDENSAYRSTVISWMENYVNNVVLNITLPDTGNRIANSYKITSIDILYKESDATAVKVLESVGVNQIQLTAGSTNSYTYNYRSQKPYKTLPESQTVRVYDKVPIRARSQDIVGNRVIYGNFISQNTPPSSIDYNIAVTRKTDTFTSWAEYPNHTLKQNRNYQAGIILSDKFGRQSPVILSSNDVLTTSGDIKFGGSTVYSPYLSKSTINTVKDWRGNTLAMIINSPILSIRNQGAGTPGLYAIVSGVNGQTSDGFAIQSGSVTDGNKYDYVLQSGASQINTPIVGNYLRGKYTDYVKIIQIELDGTIICDGDISDIYNFVGTTTPPDIKYAYDINPLGWYSYKIVVRQQQQEYYNVYLPGMLNGYPMFQTSGVSGINVTKFPVNEVDKTAHVVLINDNINKIPRDLVEVGPDQKQYRSSVELFGRVENTLISEITSNRQYYPVRKADVSSTIATSTELNFLVTSNENLKGTASNNFYQLNTSPSIARISTVNSIGVIASNLLVGTDPPDAINTMNPFLSVYETAPVVSVLDLFWESTTAGLISDLNTDVLTGSDAVIGFDNFNFSFFEWQDPDGTNYDTIDLNPGTQDSPFVTDFFKPINSTGFPVDVDNMTLTVADLQGNNRTSNFQLYKETSGLNAGSYAIKITNVNKFVYLTDSNTKENYVFTFNITDSTTGNSVVTTSGLLQNSAPIITAPSPEASIELTELTTGAIVICAGKNGAYSSIVNQQQLKWSILNTSTSGWQTYFSINETTGTISLINTSLPANTVYNINLRLTDAYNFTTNSPVTNSLSTDVSITITYTPTTDGNFCGDWYSIAQETDPPVLIPWQLNFSGRFNFWKLFQPGETIDVVNTYVKIMSFTIIGGGIEVLPINLGELVFSSSNFDGEFDYSVLRQNGRPIDTLYVSGTIRTTLAGGGPGRTINIDIEDTASLSNTNTSSNNTCTVYIPDTNKSWKLRNISPESNPVSWKALLADRVTIVSTVLGPGQAVGSVSVFDGTYTCIVEDSLTYGLGGTADYDDC
jgi:hypothetical protein